MKLTKIEKETIILFNQGEPDAEIFTYDKSWQKHLENKLGLKPLEENDSGGKTYEISKDWLPYPRKPRILSPETRAKLAERMKKLAKKRKKRGENQQ